MLIKQFKDGSANIIFTEDEKKIIKEKGILQFTPEGLRHFGNNLVKLVVDWNSNFNEDVKSLDTKSGDIETS